MASWSRCRERRSSKRANGPWDEHEIFFCGDSLGTKHGNVLVVWGKAAQTGSGWAFPVKIEFERDKTVHAMFQAPFPFANFLNSHLA